MDMHLDTSWCPSCDREIMPKRFLVPVAPPAQQGPAAPANSPIASPPKNQTGNNAAVRPTRTKSGTIRSRGGLVHGTGRVKPNGTVKRSDSTTSVKAAVAPLAAPPAQPVAPTKQRTVIDQGPIPLYCSDKCRMDDLNLRLGMLSADFDPNREEWSEPQFAGVESESDSGSGGASSFESYSSWSSNSTRSSQPSASIATLAALYGFPDLPPPPPLLEHSESQSSSSESEHNFDLFDGGVIMAARRIKAAYTPELVNKRSTNTTPTPTGRQSIPGWNDGTDAWRSSIYNLSAPEKAPRYAGDDQSTKAYRSSVASPHRSHGVLSTVGEAAPSANGASTISLPARRSSSTAPVRSTSYADPLIANYTQSFSRRCDSRTNLYNMSAAPRSMPATSSMPARSTSRSRGEKSILKPGAEGKLLVPDVKMKRSTLSLATSLDTSASWNSQSSYAASSRRSPRSPLSRHGSELSELSEHSTEPDAAASLPTTKRPTAETRSWSYDNMMTYSAMPRLPKKEKRIQKQVIDGKVKEFEVEIEVVEPLKRLFLFNDKPVRA